MLRDIVLGSGFVGFGVKCFGQCRVEGVEFGILAAWKEMKPMILCLVWDLVWTVA